MSFVGQIGVGAERMVSSRLGVAYRLGLQCGRFRVVAWYLRSVIHFGVVFQLPDLGTCCICMWLYWELFFQARGENTQVDGAHRGLRLRDFPPIVPGLHPAVRSPRTRRFRPTIGISKQRNSREEIISCYIRESGKFAGPHVEGNRFRQWAMACQFMGKIVYVAPPHGAQYGLALSHFFVFAEMGFAVAR